MLGTISTVQLRSPYSLASFSARGGPNVRCSDSLGPE